jgi:hypothetical protein
MGRPAAGRPPSRHHAPRDAEHEPLADPPQIRVKKDLDHHGIVDVEASAA